ncbi:MAG: hypothetical protein HZB91_10560 [Elusimicrobia bacterium]|nr:hypothetical protein [Elusimicrobiota bacterium]
MPSLLAAPGLAVAAFLVLGLCWLAGLLSRVRELWSCLRDAGRKSLILMAGMTVFHAWLVKPRIPHTVWHEHHPGAALESVLAGPWADAGVTLHGPAFPVTLRALRGILPWEVSVFSLDYLVSLASAWLLFLLVSVLSGGKGRAGGGDLRAAPGLAGAAMLLALPVRLRLTVSETEFILVEALFLACCLLLAFWRRHRDHRFFSLALLAAALLGQTRAEMLGLAPALLLAALLILRQEWPSGFLRSAEVWAAAGLAVLLSAPRASQILAWAEERTIGLSSSPSGLSGADWTMINAFFDPSLTPPLFMGLAAIGAAFLLARSRPLFLLVVAHLGLVSVFYLRHLDCLSLSARTSLATGWVFIGVAGFGAWQVIESIPARWVRPAWAVLAGLVLSAAMPYRGFLSRLYASQQEFKFLQEAAPRLPEAAVVAHLSAEEARSGAPVFGPSTDHARLLRLTAGKRIKIMDLSRFLADARPRDRMAGQAVGTGPPLYFYEGLNCLTPQASGAWSVVVKDYLHPLCAAMEKKFVLTPVARTLVSGESLAPESPRPGGGLIGFFRVEGALLREAVVEEAEAEEAFRRDVSAMTPDSSAIRAGLAVSRFLAREGFPGAAGTLAEVLEAFSRGRGDLAAIAGFHLRNSESGKAADLLARAARMQSGDPSLWLMAARASVQAGDRESASKALRSCREMPLDLEDSARLAVLYQDLGDRTRALALLDQLVASHPERARFLSDRAVLHSLLGHRKDAWRDAKAAAVSDPAFLPAAMALVALSDTSERRSEAGAIIGRALGPGASGAGDPSVREELTAIRERLIRKK